MGTNCMTCKEYQRLLDEVERLRKRVADLEGHLVEEQARALEANRDALTGLLSRHELERQAEHLVADQDPHGYSGQRKPVVSFCFIDMNGLKAINDQYGHGVGDAAIKFLAKVIEEHVRETDIVARAGSGADEFGIIFPSTRLGDARVIVEKIKQALRSRIFLAEGVRLRIRAAFGVSSTEEGITSRSELFRLADERMYKHKNRSKGGRRV